MTRLTTTDVQHIPRTIKKYDQELRKKTGRTLIEIARDAAQVKGNVARILSRTSAAVVPVTTGKGVIEGFSEAVAAILDHLGIKTFVTKGNDVVGVAEAIEKGGNLIFAADDNDFVAINLATRHVVHNGEATARAYVAALDCLAKGVKGKAVLVIGVGDVGSHAVADLIARRANPLVVDIDEGRLRIMKERYEDQVATFRTVAGAMRHTNLVIDAAPASNIIRSDMISANTLISAPAVPLGLTKGALKELNPQNLIHDPLQLGVAAMAVEACVARKGRSVA